MFVELGSGLGVGVLVFPNGGCVAVAAGEVDVGNGVDSGGVVLGIGVREGGGVLLAAGEPVGGWTDF